MTAAFALAHAGHADWSQATEHCIAQLAARPAPPATRMQQSLGFLYLTDGLRAHAGAILSRIKTHTGIADWAGCSGIGVCATGIEYFDEPALALMVGRFPAGSVQVFSGSHRPPEPGSRTASGASASASALVHADPQTPDLAELVNDMAGKVDDGRLFGGVASGRPQSAASVQIANRVLHGGLSGVVFGADVPMASRVTQGCHPLHGAQRRRITKVDSNLILELDGRRAIDVLLEDTGIRKPGSADSEPVQARTLPEQLKSLGRQGLYVGIETQGPLARRRTNPARDYVIRDVIGIDPTRGLVAVSGKLDRNHMMSFCTRDEPAARRDLVRICSEIRDQVADSGRKPTRPIAGAIYISCLARGSQLFKEPSEELRIIQSQLGDVPLVGFFAAGEVYGKQLYSHSGVLTAFY
jgi:small ligand-binding sensory domain FIST